MKKYSLTGKLGYSAPPLMDQKGRRLFIAGAAITVILSLMIHFSSPIPKANEEAPVALAASPAPAEDSVEQSSVPEEIPAATEPAATITSAPVALEKTNTTMKIVATVGLRFGSK